MTSGQQAVDALRAERVHYDAIFMDHMMPGMNGVEALRKIRAIGSQYADTVPIIVLTANVISGNEQRFLETGFQAFLAKPIDMQRLDAVIQHFVRDKTKEKAMPPARPESSAAETDDGQAEKKASLLRNAIIPGLDAGGALRRFSGNVDAYWQALESYLRHTPKLLEQARAVSATQTDDYIIAIHGIKGSSLGIGAALVGQQAEKLEAAARKSDLAFIAAHNSECVEAVERLLADLSALLKDGQGAEKPLGDAPDPELLARLGAACAAYDMDGVDAAMAELDACRYRSQQDIVDWLRDQAGVMELGRMAEELAKSTRNRKG
jgi:CheY-like chemotaxis protein